MEGGDGCFLLGRLGVRDVAQRLSSPGPDPLAFSPLPACLSTGAGPNLQAQERGDLRVAQKGCSASP